MGCGVSLSGDEARIYMLYKYITCIHTLHLALWYDDIVYKQQGQDTLACNKLPVVPASDHEQLLIVTDFDAGRPRALGAKRVGNLARSLRTRVAADTICHTRSDNSG